MRYRYDMQLHTLDTQLTHMGELCEAAITKVTQALKDGNTEQAQVVIKEIQFRFLVPDGLVHLKTDSNFMFTYTKYMIEANHFPVEFMTDIVAG